MVEEMPSPRSAAPHSAENLRQDLRRVRVGEPRVLSQTPEPSQPVVARAADEGRKVDVPSIPSGAPPGPERGGTLRAEPSQVMEWREPEPPESASPRMAFAQRERPPVATEASQIPRETRPQAESPRPSLASALSTTPLVQASSLPPGEVSAKRAATPTQPLAEPQVEPPLAQRATPLKGVLGIAPESPQPPSLPQIQRHVAEPVTPLAQREETPAQVGTQPRSMTQREVMPGPDQVSPTPGGPSGFSRIRSSRLAPKIPLAPSAADVRSGDEPRPLQAETQPLSRGEPPFALRRLPAACPADIRAETVDRMRPSLEEQPPVVPTSPVSRAEEIRPGIEPQPLSRGEPPFTLRRLSTLHSADIQAEPVDSTRPSPEEQPLAAPMAESRPASELPVAPSLGGPSGEGRIRSSRLAKSVTLREPRADVLPASGVDRAKPETLPPSLPGVTPGGSPAIQTLPVEAPAPLPTRSEEPVSLPEKPQTDMPFAQQAIAPQTHIVAPVPERHAKRQESGPAREPVAQEPTVAQFVQREPEQPLARIETVSETLAGAATRSVMPQDTGLSALEAPKNQVAVTPRPPIQAALPTVVRREAELRAAQRNRVAEPAMPLVGGLAGQGDVVEQVTRQVSAPSIPGGPSEPTPPVERRTLRERAVDLQRETGRAPESRAAERPQVAVTPEGHAPSIQEQAEVTAPRVERPSPDMPLYKPIATLRDSIASLGTTRNRDFACKVQAGVRRMESPQGAPGAAEREVEAEPTRSVPLAPPRAIVHRAPEATLRERTPSSQPVTEHYVARKMDEQPDATRAAQEQRPIDLDQVARQIYPILKRMLAVEMERRA